MAATQHGGRRSDRAFLRRIAWWAIQGCCSFAAGSSDCRWLRGLQTFCCASFLLLAQSSVAVSAAESLRGTGTRLSFSPLLASVSCRRHKCSMQASSAPVARQRTPVLSDSESDHTAGPGSYPSTSRPQRPHLAHASTTGGSFVRLKRRANTAAHANGDATPTFAGERTVDQQKTCFICYEDEGEEGSSHGKWVHPCKCSLVAHEDCLLHWISVSKPTASQTVPVTCPQCAAPYTIAQLNFPLLNLIEKVEDVWAKNVGRLLAVGAGVGTWTLLSLYGIWAIRKFVGDRVAEQRESGSITVTAAWTDSSAKSYYGKPHAGSQRRSFCQSWCSHARTSLTRCVCLHLLYSVLPLTDWAL